MYKKVTNNHKFDKRIVKRLILAVKSIHALYGDLLIEISVFGSYAKGSQKRYSSVDLLVVVTESDERFVKRNADVQKLLNENDEIPLIDPLIYKEEEILDLIHEKESFIVSALKETFVVWNNFNEINLEEVKDSNRIPSRYLASIPNLEEID
ncbi:MAG: nucleotidyltransferase domain-containing protein [Candidatus Dojkabacteria bacterium]